MAEDRPKWGGPPLEGKRDLTIGEKMFGDIESSSPTVNFVYKFAYAVAVAPAVWFRENVVEKLRGPEQHWYHRRYRRVPTIDECYFHDWACRFEAQEQMERDKMVEEQICLLLKYRAIDCANRERYMAVDQLDPTTRCGELLEDSERAAANFYIKYGDMRTPIKAEEVLMKQKHRLIWERRNGPLPTIDGLTLDKE